MTDLSIEVGVALTLSGLNPFDVEKAIAGWTRGGDEVISSGIVFKRKSGYTLVYDRRELPKRTTIMIEHYSEEPVWLYERAAPWVFNEEELNANLPQYKAETKNGVSAGTFYPADTGSVVRS
jgi:hypothetical protein